MKDTEELPGVILVLVGPSGVGKDTIKKELLKRKPNVIVRSISVTTRNPRGTEQDGQDFFFWDKEKFEQGITDGLFIEHALVGDRYYGTLRSTVINTLKDTKILIMDLDVQGALQIKQIAKECGWKIFDVFITPPSLVTLARRIRGKKDGMPETEIQNRLERAKGEIAQKSKFSFRVKNDDLDSAVKRIMALARGKKPR